MPTISMVGNMVSGRVVVLLYPLVNARHNMLTRVIISLTNARHKYGIHACPYACTHIIIIDYHYYHIIIISLPSLIIIIPLVYSYYYADFCLIFLF